MLDSKGQAIPGATVLEKGTSNGVVTDVSGQYTITVSGDNAELVIQAIGLETQTIKVGARTTIDITMSDSKALDEVVVVGYKTQIKSEVTGAVSTLKPATFDKIPVVNFTQMLQGSAPGVLSTVGSGQPGTVGNVRIRGISSINSGTNPLYVIDGIPVRSGTSGLNPLDFVSTSVLKDAASSSQYGSRASNGVIQITTSDGRVGKTQFDYSFQQGFSVVTNPNLSLMTSAEKVRFEELAFNQGLTIGQFGNALADFDAGNITSGELQAERARLSNTGEGVTRNGWADNLFRTGRTTQHALSVSGGNRKTTFFISGNYFREEGTLQRSYFERYAFRVNTRTKLNKIFTFGQKLFLSATDNSTPSSNGGVNTQNPVVNAFIANPYLNEESPNNSFINSANPRRVVEGTENSNLNYRVLGNIYLEAKFLKDFRIRTSWGANFNSGTNRRREDPESPQGQGAAIGTGGTLSRSTGTNTTIIGTTTLSYSKIIGEKHRVFATIGNELIDENAQSHGFTGYSLNRLPNTPAAADQGQAIHNINGGNNDNALIGWFAFANYLYDNKYGISASFRRDASSRFGFDSRWGNFYSVGATWNINEENFMKGISIIDTLKLRGSYGTTGNQNIGNFDYVASYGSFTYNGNQAIAPTSLPDRNLRWETTTMANIGLDFSLWKGRINGTVEYYNNLTKDLFLPVQLSRTTGFATQSSNAGTMRNSGVEFSLEVYPINYAGFTWSVRGNFTANTNVIEDLGVAEEFITGTSINREGLPATSQYVVRWGGVDPSTGDALYYDANGNLTNNFPSDAQVAFAPAEPPRFGGITNEFTYKNETIGTFSLSAFVTFAYGHQLFNNPIFFVTNTNFAGIANQDQSMLSAWTTEGQITDVPRIGVLRNFSSRDLENGAYARLRTVRFSYALPGRWLRSTKLRYASIFFVGQNLFTWTSLYGLDPEDSNNINSFDYPPPRVFTFGVNIGF